MPEFLTGPFHNGPAVNPVHILIRLLFALALGGIVAWIYLRTSRVAPVGTSFPITLALLSVLIAMSTQVIGDNVARAFSLVGALSIVRFRTVVRDTKDTAYVIFAVVVGMAVGAQNPWAAVIGVAVVGVAAFVVAARTQTVTGPEPTFLLTVRIGLGYDLEELLGSTLGAHLRGRDVLSVVTARQGASLDVTYDTRLHPDGSAEELVKALNRIEGVQDVRLQRRDFEEE